MMGTAEEVDDSESVTLIEFMEEQNIVIGKQHQFLGILTTNTNPLTMVRNVYHANLRMINGAT